MTTPGDEARKRRQQDRIGGTIFIIGAAVMSVVTVLLGTAVPLPGRLGADAFYGGLAVWAFMAIMGIIMVRRSAPPMYVDASQWAAASFPMELNDIASRVADILVEELNVPLSDLRANTQFVADLKMTDLEPVEVLMEVEKEFHISIPPEDWQRLETIADLVHYLHPRVHTRAGSRPDE